jgi:leucyl aminopeptidase
MVSAEAFRPGDILTASNGKTIEVTLRNFSFKKKTMLY